MRATTLLRRPSPTLLVSLCALPVAWFLWSGLSVLDASPDAPKIAVVDLFRVLKEASPFVKSEEELRVWINGEKQALQKLSDEVEQKQKELMLFNPNSAEYIARRNDAEIMQLQFKHVFETRERERMARIIQNQRRSFADARRAVAEASSNRGVDLVLQLRDGDPTGDDPQEVTSEIYLRDVLYHDQALDITSDVLKILNR